MTERNTGGPAFPAMHHDLTEGEHGISMRDYFAAMALNGICANQAMLPAVTDNRAYKSAESFAGAAYVLADAMLEARKT